VAKEPVFKEQNNYANRVVNYPNNVISDTYFKEQKTFVGKEFKYSFIIGKKQDEKEEDDKPKPNCYKNCEKCETYSEKDDDQKCLTCKTGFYFKEGTKNCYSEQPSKSYFDKEKGMWMSCHKNCLTCSGKATENKMNCLTCESGVNFYQKSSNCLKCPTFVNFNQTDCLITVPKGYFIEDRNLGIIGKCYDLCATCDKGPIYAGGMVSIMNCKTCLFESKGKTLKEGECPPSPGKGADHTKEEEEEKEVVKTQKNVLLSFTIIICAVLAVLIIGVVVFLFCYNSRSKEIKANNTDYYNIGGKNIPFEDENNNNNNSNNNNFAIN
jgi:hypothetical protein